MCSFVLFGNVKMETKYISQKLHIELAMKTSASESTVKIKWPLVSTVAKRNEIIILNLQA